MCVVKNQSPFPSKPLSQLLAVFFGKHRALLSIVVLATGDFSFDQLHVPNLGRRISQSVLSPASLIFRLRACDIFPWKRHGDQADVVTSRRAAGQRTNELLESVVATLNSPGTRMWVQVLGEVRRVGGGVEEITWLSKQVLAPLAGMLLHLSPIRTTFAFPSLTNEYLEFYEA